MRPSPSLPREGMMAQVRNRRGIVASVEAFPPEAGPEGRLHLVRIAYTDADGKREESLIWEREAGAKLIESQAQPHVAAHPPMDEREFNSLVRASRWGALTPTLELAGINAPLIASPFFGALQVEDYQLVPLLRALTMPRVTLLLADGVGLGKTIESGLILRELMLRRRIRRVLILCPATLRLQWQQEMQEKFALPFDIIDRKETLAIQRRLGIDANPWKVQSKAIVSYQYLRQPEVFEQFRAAAEPQRDGTQGGEPSFGAAPWDLLIVDEAHNMSPVGMGPDSELSRMLRRISPWFEHRIFLTATPHNGHTRSFSGLLEALDPVRFSRTSAFTPEEKQRIEQVVVRRLKRDLEPPTGPSPFTNRQVKALPDLVLGDEERALSQAFAGFRLEVRRRGKLRSESLAGAFAIEVLSKRLLSGPATFARSWWRCMEGMETTGCARPIDVQMARKAAAIDLADDAELEARATHAMTVVGSWLSTMATPLQAPIARIKLALSALGLGREEGFPTRDARYETLKRFTDTSLCSRSAWRDDERLIIFTEYKTTLDYLARRLAHDYRNKGEGAVRVLYGGMRDEERQQIKEAFNDPSDPIRILVATDAASEGLNLQATCRYLLHWDIPWNPSRMEQRNGRLDRHGQARDVTIFHFSSADDDTLRFMGRLLEKRSQIREDRILADPLFSEAIEAHFLTETLGDDLLFQLDLALAVAPTPDDLPLSAPMETGEEPRRALGMLAEKLDLSPESLQDTLEVAMGLGCGLPRMEGPDERGRFKLLEPVPAAWRSLLEQTPPGTGTARGLMAALPRLTFDPRNLLHETAGRTVFRPEKNTFLMHLGHPILQQALGAIARARFQPERFSRWIVRRGELPPDAEAAILLTVEELAANCLQETSHHWVRTLCFPIRDGKLQAPLEAPPPRLTPLAPSMRTRGKTREGEAPKGKVPSLEADLIEAARELWGISQGALQDALVHHADDLTHRLEDHFERHGAAAIADEKNRFQQRLAEIGRSLRENTLTKLERDREAFAQAMRQTTFLVAVEEAREQRLFDLTKELDLRRRHFKELRAQLEEERDRLVERTLPSRYRLKDRLQVLPVAVEIRFPEV